MGERTLTQSKFEFTFSGENEIDVNTLISGLQSLNSLVMATKDTCMENTECNLKVVAHKQGSFIAELIIAAQTAYTMMTPDTINYAANCASLIVDFFEIKRHIGNHIPKKWEKKKDKLSVENINGETKTFPAQAEGFFKDAKIENSIIQIISSADKNSDVNGIKVITDQKESVEINRSEFKNINEPVVEDIDHPIQKIQSTDLIYIRQSACFGESKWEFQKDHRFFAKILDDQWMKEYREGKHPIVPGIQLRVEMTSYLHIGDDELPIEGKTTFEITRVIDTIYPQKFPQFKLENI